MNIQGFSNHFLAPVVASSSSTPSTIEDDEELVKLRLDRPFCLSKSNHTITTPRGTYLVWFEKLQKMGVEVLGLHLHGSAVPISKKTFEKLAGVSTSSWNPTVDGKRVDYDDRVVLKTSNVSHESILKSLFEVWGESRAYKKPRIEGDLIFLSLGTDDQKWDITITLCESCLPCIDLAPYVDVLDYLRTGDPKTLNLKILGGGTLLDWARSKIDGKFVVKNFNGINFGWFLRLVCKMTEGQIPENWDYGQLFLPSFVEGKGMIQRLVNSFKAHLPQDATFARCYFYNVASLFIAHQDLLKEPLFPLIDQLHQALFAKKLTSMDEVADQLAAFQIQALGQVKLILGLSKDGKVPSVILSVAKLTSDLEQLNQILECVVWGDDWERLRAAFLASKNFWIHCNIYAKMREVNLENSKPFLLEIIQQAPPALNEHRLFAQAKLSPWISTVLKHLPEQLGENPYLLFSLALAKGGIINLAYQMWKKQAAQNGEIFCQMVIAMLLKESSLTTGIWQCELKKGILKQNPHQVAEVLQKFIKFLGEIRGVELLVEAASFVPDLSNVFPAAQIQTYFLQYKKYRETFFDHFGARLWDEGEETTGKEILSLLYLELPIHKVLLLLELKSTITLDSCRFHEAPIDVWMELMWARGEEKNYNILARYSFDQLRKKREIGFCEVKSFDGASFVGTDCIPIMVEMVKANHMLLSEFERKISFELFTILLEKFVPKAPVVIPVSVPKKKKVERSVCLTIPEILNYCENNDPNEKKGEIERSITLSRGKLSADQIKQLSQHLIPVYGTNLFWELVECQLETMSPLYLWPVCLFIAEKNEPSETSSRVMAKLIKKTIEETISTSIVQFNSEYVKCFWRYLGLRDTPIWINKHESFKENFDEIYRQGLHHRILLWENLALKSSFNAHCILTGLFITCGVTNGCSETSKKERRIHLLVALGVLEKVWKQMAPHERNVLADYLKKAVEKYSQDFKEPFDVQAINFMYELSRVSSLSFRLTTKKVLTACLIWVLFIAFYKIAKSSSPPKGGNK